jgi:DNA-binding transcriptional ArsR family regulator
MKPSTVQAEIFKALGHPVRLRIVTALRDGGDACVCHLEHELGLRQAYLSQHLAKLRAAGVVSDQRVGSNVFYALAGGWVAELLSTLEAGSDLRTPPAPGPGARRRRSRTCPCPRCGRRQAGAEGDLTSRPGRSMPA